VAIFRLSSSNLHESRQPADYLHHMAASHENTPTTKDATLIRSGRLRTAPIVWINGVAHVPLGGSYGSPKERTKLRRSITSWVRGQQDSVALEHGTSRLRWHGVSLRLTPLQFRVVSVLAAARGGVVARDQLLLEAWGHVPATKGSELVRAQIAGIRRALRGAGLADRLVQNVWGGSYRLAVPIAEASPPNADA
jgi:DNA-binding winged helix-turn-helix (wHTH) protein